MCGAVAQLSEKLGGLLASWSSFFEYLFCGLFQFTNDVFAWGSASVFDVHAASNLLEGLLELCNGFAVIKKSCNSLLVSINDWRRECLVEPLNLSGSLLKGLLEFFAFDTIDGQETHDSLV